MTFSTAVIDGSGTASSIEGSASVLVSDVQEIRVAAAPEQVLLCQRGTDLLVNFDDGTTQRFVNFFADGESASTTLLLQAPEGGFAPAITPEGTCEIGALLPTASSLTGVAGLSLLTRNLTALGMGAGAVGLAAALDPGPKIGKGAAAGGITERADGSAGENTATLHMEGEISFSNDGLAHKQGDYKAIARLASAEDSVHGPVTGHGTLTPSVRKLPSGEGTVTWSFAVGDAEIDYLAAGQTITQRYKIILEDADGRTDEAEVTITITGTNDAPVITGGTSSAHVSEPSDGGASAGVMEMSHDLQFADVDLIDIHQVTATLVSAQDSARGSVGGRGTFAASIARDSTGTGMGDLGWHYQVDASAIDDLAEGQTITQTYEIAVSDGHGGTGTKQVTVTLTGSNDGPVAEAIAADISESGSAITIEARYSDVDAIDTHTFSVNTAGTAGRVINNGDGTFSYDPSGAFDHLGANETATDTFTYTVRDSSGAESTETVTITIVGENDLPTVPNVSLERSVEYRMGFESTPDLAGWTTDTSLSGPVTGGTSSVTIDRSGTVIAGDGAVAVFEIGGQVAVGSQVWGPKITSQTFAGEVGDTVSYQYLLEGGLASGVGDRAHMRVFIVYQNGVTREVFSTSANMGTSTGVQVETETLEFSGPFRLEFQLGSTDASSGGVVGATLSLGYVEFETDLLSSNAIYAFDESELLAQASDPNGDALDVISVSATSAFGASVSIGPDGRIYYDPRGAGIAVGAEVTDTFTFTVSDGNGGVVTATASVSVMGVGPGVETSSSAAMLLTSDMIDLDLSTYFLDAADDSIFIDDAGTPIATGNMPENPHMSVFYPTNYEPHPSEMIIA